MRRYFKSALQGGLRQFGLQLNRIRENTGYKGPRPPSLDERHVQNCQVLPSREVLVDKLPKNGIVAEAGVAEGEFSSTILERSNPSQLYLIDAWAAERYSAAVQQVRARFERQLHDGRIVIKQGLSTDVLGTFPDRYFDWIYIDTDHTYDTTLEELFLCSRKVKNGGFIAGHDFSPGNPNMGFRYGVIPACHEFCVKEGWELIYLTIEYDINFSFCLREIA